MLRQNWFRLRVSLSRSSSELDKPRFRDMFSVGRWTHERRSRHLSSTYSSPVKRDHKVLSTRQREMTDHPQRRWYTDEAWEMFRYVRQNKRESPFVYVVSERDDPESLLKIGTAKDPTSRVSSMQTGNPRSLGILRVVAGDRELELTLHARWLLSQVTGEWYTHDARILADMDKLAAMQRDGLWLQTRFTTALQDDEEMEAWQQLWAERGMREPR